MKVYSPCLQHLKAKPWDKCQKFIFYFFFENGVFDEPPDKFKKKKKN